VITNKSVVEAFFQRDSAKSKNLVSDGASLYSYGWYEIARWNNFNGVSITTNTYSKTTAKHISYVRALAHSRWTSLTYISTRSKDDCKLGEPDYFWLALTNLYDNYNMCIKIHPAAKNLTRAEKMFKDEKTPFTSLKFSSEWPTVKITTMLRERRYAIFPSTAKLYTGGDYVPYTIDIDIRKLYAVNTHPEQSVQDIEHDTMLKSMVQPGDNSVVTLLEFDADAVSRLAIELANRYNGISTTVYPPL